MNEFDLAGPWRYQAHDSAQFALGEFDNSNWPEMTIPQNWFLGGLDHHGAVWFRRRFDYDLQEGRFATLRFDGVDYFADVYLNGEHLGHHEGYFEPFEFDVTGIVRQGPNTLAVRVDSPFEPVGPEGWHMRKRLIKGVLNHHDCRPGGGWVASGQAHNTGGIWNRVTLLTHGAITIEQVLLKAELDQEPPRLKGDIRITNRAGLRLLPISILCTPDNFEAGFSYKTVVEVEIEPGANLLNFTLPVPDIYYWQPWDRGYPHLYTIDLSHPAAEASYKTHFGFRSVEVDESYRWRINGQPYFPRGSNYITSQWLSETLFPNIAAAGHHPFPAPEAITAPTGESWFARDVALMKEANLNMIRVHAHVLPAEFHQACDRTGLLVWQDFPFQWGYSDEIDFHEEAARQMKAMVQLLHNHPSIVTWCIHNESPWDAGWMAEEAGGSYDPRHNRALDAHLEQLVQGLDSSRHIQKNSGTGDGHVYPGWYYDHWLDYRNMPGAPFPTEYGAQGIPCLTSTGHMFRQFGEDAGHAALVRFKKWLDDFPHWAMAKDMPPLEEVPKELHDAYEVWRSWRFHDFQPPETFYWAGIGLGDSLAEFIANSQAYQNLILQFGTEKYRQHKYGLVNGIMQFMFVEPWPSITWAVLDYWRQPKESFEVLKRAMQPILPIVDGALEPVQAGESLGTTLIVVNDGLQAYPHARYRWTLWAEGDEVPLATAGGEMDIPADGLGQAILPASPPLDFQSYCLTVDVLSAEEQPLGHNQYIIRPLAAKKGIR